MARVVSPPGCVCAVHVTVQFSMDDNTKAQCVVCLRDGGYNLGPGPQTHNFFMPLTTDGLPYLDRMGRVSAWLSPHIVSLPPILPLFLPYRRPSVWFVWTTAGVCACLWWLLVSVSWHWGW